MERAQLGAQIDAIDSDGVLLARKSVSWQRGPQSCWYAPGTEPVLSVEPQSGSCRGDVTIRGERFPNDVRVEVMIWPYGGDSPVSSVGITDVNADGTFEMKAKLSAKACALAANSPEGSIYLHAYNADEPKGMDTFAGVVYKANDAPHGPSAIVAPATGEGPIAEGPPIALLAAITTLAGATLLAVPFVLKKRRS